MTRNVNERPLTERELAHLSRTRRFGRILLVLAPLVIAGYVLERELSAMSWRETKCSVSLFDDKHRARYWVAKRPYDFNVGTSAPDEGEVTCWVPTPPSDGIGTLTRPTGASVPLREKLQPWWFWVAAILFGIGVLAPIGARVEERNRKAGHIARDDFSSSD